MYIFLEKQDFIRCHFLNGWHRLIGSVGDGVQIDFPVKVRLFFVMESKDLYLDRGVNYTLPTI